MLRKLGFTLADVQDDTYRFQILSGAECHFQVGSGNFRHFISGKETNSHSNLSIRRSSGLGAPKSSTSRMGSAVGPEPGKLCATACLPTSCLSIDTGFSQIIAEQDFGFLWPHSIVFLNHVLTLEASAFVATIQSNTLAQGS